MNNKKQAVQKIANFLNSNDKILFLKGTHQNQKHPIALGVVLSKCSTPKDILFRANRLDNIDTFIEPFLELPNKPKTGKAFQIKSGINLYFDSFNRSSWEKTPNKMDIVIIYPTDSLKKQTGIENVNDALNRNAEKILLVTWTDNVDYSWIDQYNPTTVIYDAEEEDIDYHKRILDLIKKANI